MKQSSKNQENVFKWIKKVLESCKTIDQCQTTKNLIENFAKRVKSENFKGHFAYVEPLMKLYRNKVTELSR